MNIQWYSIYKKASGEIVATMTADDDSIEVNTPVDCSAVVGGYEASKGFISNGVFVPYSADQAAAKRDRPTWSTGWSNAGMQWVDPRTAEQATADAWVEATRKRDVLLADSDWRVIREVETKAPMPGPWKVYRQALRDITQQPSPFALIWPTPPA
jgi:hypothetical protein